MKILLRFFLSVDEFSNAKFNPFKLAFEESIADSNIICKFVTPGSESGSNLTQGSIITAAPIKYTGPVDINKLRIKIIDQFGRTVDLQGIDVSITLVFTRLYTSNKGLSLGDIVDGGGGVFSSK